MKDGSSVTRILLVEDNPMDIRLLRLTFEREQAWSTELTVVGDGEEAIEHLLAPENPKPDLIVLDLNLPKRDGAEVLEVIRGKLRAHRLPVVIFSSSPEDAVLFRLREVNLTADFYVTKPVDIESFFKLAKRFRECYDEVVRRNLETPDRTAHATP